MYKKIGALFGAIALGVACCGCASTQQQTQPQDVLQVGVAQAKATYDVTDEFNMRLSEHEEFQSMELSKDVTEAIHEAETATK